MNQVLNGLSEQANTEMIRVKRSDLWPRLQGRYRWSASRFFVRRRCQVQNTVPFISFCFDDFPSSALVTGGAILERYRLAGTYYASLGLMRQPSPVGIIFTPEHLPDLLARGHELGCHTFAHCHSWETRPRVFEESIIENQRVLSELLAGTTFRTFSYPKSWPRPAIKRRASKYFVCCRGGGQTFNAGTTDLNNLSAYFLEKTHNDAKPVKSLIDQNCQARGWLILATHDICDTPSPFGCTPAFFEEIVRYAVDSGARVLPVFSAWEAIAAASTRRFDDFAKWKSE
jgi:peptidoglycan/xylan/chitin deacetylase (PgdA/CDA1 family)